MNNDKVIAASTHFMPAVGGEIIGQFVTPDGQEWGFTVRKADMSIIQCWVQRDPENNGPGFIALETAEDE